MKLKRLFNTLRFLKPVQIYGRAWFRLYSPDVDQRNAPACRVLHGIWVEPVQKSVSLASPVKFRFLNQEHVLAGTGDWNNPEWDKLWLYNLHYFDDLNAENSEYRKDWHVALIDKWINENPAGQGNGWEPYPTSLRVVNWVKWSLAGNDLSEAAEQSLAVQVRFLRKRLEIHLLGNHLFANAKALIFAGLFFDGVEAKAWLSKGLEILENQLPEQILADGGHFERSPMYHSIILEDLLDLIHILRAYDQRVPDTWLDTAQRMLAWLNVMQHPDNDIPLFNDAAFGIAPKPLELSAYAERLGICPEYNHGSCLTHLKDTGYVRLQKGQAVAFLDVAPIGPDYLPGHAHADTLSFELSLFGQRVIVNSGTSCYGVSAERLRQRGTAAHNTVVVNGEDSSEVWGGFRVARRASPSGLEITETAESVGVVCSHTGYRRLSGKPLHRREWRLSDNSLNVKDTIEGSFESATGRFYLHPDVDVHIDNSCEGTMILSEGNQVKWKFEHATVKIVNSTWHPGFGLSIPNKCLEVAFIKKESVASFTWV